MAVATSGAYTTATPKLIPPSKLRVYKGTTSAPAATTALANASAVVTSTVTCTGVAVGDVVVGFGIVSGRATNQHPVAAYVSAADTITVTWSNLVNTSVTLTAAVMNFIVADVT